MTEVPLYVGGARQEGSDPPNALYDPSTGRALGWAAAASPHDVDCAVSVAAEAQRDWRRRPPAERGRLLTAAAQRLRSHVSELAELDAVHAGLPLRMAHGDVENAARYLEYYAGACDKLAGETIPLGPGFVDYTVREPYGVCGVIVPFNVPLQMAARSVAPAVAAGNAVVVKSSEQAPGPVLALAEQLTAAGLPDGLVNVLTGDGPRTGNALVSNPGIGHVTFTGSLAAGRAVLQAAAQNVTPATIELGGKSPQIVFDDANLDAAANAIVGSALLTAGQVCSAGTRVLVHKPVYDELAERLVQRAGSMRIAPAGTDPDMGPLISASQRDQVVQRIEEARDEAGEPLVGLGAAACSRVPGEGYFVPPTIFGGVDPSASVAREEIFGPVLALVSFADEQDALQIANDSEFGLVAGVWTQRLGLAHRLAGELQAGQVFVNNYGVGGGVELPFGGYRRSGMGREKGMAALLEYTQLKNVCVRVAE